MDQARERATGRLVAAQSGDHGSEEQLFVALCEELKHIAGSLLGEERANHTLRPTALVHEAWLRVIDAREAGPEGRGRFLGLAARAMRRILVEHARARQRLKRGGEWRRVDMAAEVVDPGAECEILAIDGELEVLASTHPRKRRVGAGTRHESLKPYFPSQDPTNSRCPAIDIWGSSGTIWLIA